MLFLVLACTAPHDDTAESIVDSTPDTAVEVLPPSGQGTTDELEPDIPPSPYKGVWTREDLGTGWSGATACRDWQLTDLTGDGVLELVFTRDCTREDNAWVVTPLDGSGPYPWSAPDADGQFVDIDLDGAPDLVVDWTVHPNLGDGFGDAWPHPRPEDEACAEYELMDLDGDGRLDLLSDCGAQLANGNGWDAPIVWETPILLDTFSLASGVGTCLDEEMTWRVADLDGDGWAELVVEDICATEQSRVYAGAPTGWTDTTPWALPTGSGGWRLLDADGREELDLVAGDAVWLSTGTGFNAQPVGPESGRTGRLVGRFLPDQVGLLIQEDDRWHIEAVTGLDAELDPPLQPEPLPEAPEGTTLDRGGSADCVSWTAKVLDTDDGLSLLITEDCEDAAMGVLYVDTLDLQDGSRSRLGVPMPVAAAFNGAWSRLQDLDGDGQMDLVQTSTDATDWTYSLRGPRGWTTTSSHPKPDKSSSLIALSRTCSSGKTTRSSSGRLADLNGDGHPDQFWTKDDCNVVGGASHAHPKVRLNTGDGEFEAPVAWTLPSGVSLNVSGGTSSGCGLTGDLTDLDGDGYLDILQPCDGGWSLTYGSETGWEETVDFSLPPTSEALSKGLSGTVECSDGSGKMRWGFLQADDQPGMDLVFFSDPCDGSDPVGVHHWRVHSNTGTGFAEEGAELSLPPAPNASYGYPRDVGSASCNGGTNRHSWELLSDELASPILLQTENSCDGAEVGDRTMAALPL